MDEEERLEIMKEAQKYIRFCPHCGYESDKEFDGVDTNGGDWVCTNCKEQVEAYILSDRFDEEVEQWEIDNAAYYQDKEKGKFPLIGLIVALIIAVIFFISL